MLRVLRTSATPTTMTGLLLVALMAASTDAISQDLRLDVGIKHGVVPGGESSVLTARCSLNASLAAMTTPMSLAILASRPYGHQDQFHLIGSIDVWSKEPNISVDLDSESSQVSGQIGAGPDTATYLAVSWAVQKKTGAGLSYKCLARGVDESGKPVSSSRAVTLLTAETCLLNAELVKLKEKIKRMDDEFKRFHSKITAKFHRSDIFKGKIYLVSEYKLDYLSAATRCEHAGGYLVEIDDAEENKFVQGLLKSTHEHFSLFWIGTNDIDNEGVYMFHHSKKRASFLDWNEGEPNDKKDEEDCVETLLPLEKFNDNVCTKKALFVCEVPWPNLL